MHTVFIYLFTYLLSHSFSPAALQTWSCGWNCTDLSLEMKEAEAQTPSCCFPRHVPSNTKKNKHHFKPGAGTSHDLKKIKIKKKCTAWTVKAGCVDQSLPAQPPGSHGVGSNGLGPRHFSELQNIHQTCRKAAERVHQALTVLKGGIKYNHVESCDFQSNGWFHN